MLLQLRACSSSRPSGKTTKMPKWSTCESRCRSRNTKEKGLGRQSPVIQPAVAGEGHTEWSAFGSLQLWCSFCGSFCGKLLPSSTSPTPLTVTFNNHTSKGLGEKTPHQAQSRMFQAPWIWIGVENINTCL